MPILRDIAVLILLVWIFVDGFVVNRRKSGNAENRDRSSLRLLMVMGPLVWVVSIGLAFTSVGLVHDSSLQGFGLLMMLAGIAVRCVAIAQLGRFHTPNVAILTDHQLKATGLYRYVRHPSYLGGLIAFVGFGLALGNVLSLLVIVLITPATYIYRIREEEGALSEAFGETYREYCLQTRRLLPWLY